ncbi:phage tail length tape measure family protein [Acidovorax sp. Root217]|uniref:phage tail length tape measure family protein n=1 Tax=Acidovorax sp. Root217 TaxID=1736492 RepID=UPI00070DF7EA|nr:phage tail length tape measure family protein [Acidovorax sp. Root217]
MKRDVRGTAEDIKDAADGASKSIAGIGDGGQQASQKVEASARSMIREIQRVTASAQAGEKGTASYYAELAKQRNLGTSLDPYIEKLRQAEAAQRAATGGMGKMQVSAAQTAAALRGVPAQFTDIITSLQGGQAPLTVLLQQGGQLKDMFGGAGNAAKALGGYVVGLINPLTVVVAAVGALGFAVASAEGDARKLSSIGIAFQATGRAALLSTEDIKSLRREMSLLPGVSKDAAGTVINEFARTREIGGSMLKGLGRGIADFAVALGQDVPTAAKTLAKAFADPAKGAKDLDDALGFLTSNQLLAINAMVEAGDKAGAQKLMLEALTTATKGLASEGTKLQQATTEFGRAWTETMGQMDSRPLQLLADRFADVVTGAAKLLVEIRKLKDVRLPPWLERQFYGGLNGALLGTSSEGFDQGDPRAPPAPTPVSRPVNWNGGKGQRPLGMGDLDTPTTMFGQQTAPGPLRIEYTPKASPVTPMGAPTPAPALTSKELDDQAKTLIEINKNYKSQKGQVEDIRKEIALTSKTLKLVAAEDKANGVQNSPRAERLQEILDGQKEKLESTLKKGGGMADVANAAVQAFKNADKEILRERKAFFDEMDAMVKAGKVGEMDAAERSMEMEDVLYAQRKANFEAELANAKTKKNSDTEQARIKGQMDAAETEHEEAIKRLRRESSAAVAKATDDLERMVATEEKAARASTAKLKGARDENKEIGLTGEALGKVRQARVDEAAAELERQAVTAQGIDPTGRLSAALRQQAQDLRDLAKEKGFGDSARMVADYTKAVNESAAAIQYETSVMGLSSRERDVAIAKYKIEIDLAQRLAKIKADNPDNPGEADRLSADARATANKDKDNAEKRIQLDEVKQTVEQYGGIFRQGFADMLNNGKDGWKSFTKSLATTFKTSVADAIYKHFAQPLVVNVVSALMGIGGGGGGVGGASSGSPLGSLFSLGSSAYQGYTGLTSGQGVLGSIGNAFGLGGGGAGLAASNAASAANGLSALQATNVGSFGGVGSGVIGQGGAYTATGAGAGAGSFAAGGIAALIMLGVINALGGMRSESMVGSGLAGTLGGNKALTPWQEWREGGTLFDGSSFATHNPLEELTQRRAELQRLRDSGQGQSNYAMGIQAVVTDLEKTTKGLAEQTAVFDREITKGYKSYRDNVVKMADSLNLGGDAVKDFAYTLGAQDLNFQGLNPEQIQAKIAETFGKAGTDMAQLLLGSWKDVTDTIVNTWSDTTDPHNVTFTTETTTNKREEYVPSEFAKVGETAIQTLTRLATSFNTLNEASDALGFGIHKGSLSLANFADNFIEAFGGLERFSTQTKSFLQNYYTDGEQKEAGLRAAVRGAERIGLKGVTVENLSQAGKSGIRDGVNSLVTNPELYGDAMEWANGIAWLFDDIDDQVPVVQELSTAVDQLTESYKNAVKSLTDERKNLLVGLSRAKGDEVGARALERQNYLDSFVDDAGNKLDPARLAVIATMYDGNLALKDEVDLRKQMLELTQSNTDALAAQRAALSASNQALFDNVQALKTRKSIDEELPAVLDKYRTRPQRRQAQYEEVAKGLTDAGIGVTATQLANASKTQFAEAAVAVWNLGTTTDTMRLAITRAASVMADIKDAEIDEAFAALERAVSAQLQTAEKTRDEIKAVFELLESSVDDLYGEVESTAKAAAQQGVDFITQALSAAQKTGYLPEVKELSKAISDARSGFNATQYSSQFERDKDRLVLAGKLSDLEDISGEQLTEAERQVKSLEDIVKNAEAQINELRGINSGVVSVSKAVQDLADAISGKNAAATTRPASVIVGKGGAQFDKVTDAGTTSAGVHFDASDMAAAAQAVIAANPGASGKSSVLDALEGKGFSMPQYNEMFGLPPGTLEAEAKALGRPIFHDGTTFVPETGYALLQRGEAVFPTAHNPFVNGRGLGDTSRLEVQLARLTAEVQRLQGLQEVGNTHAEATADLLDNVTEGGNGIRAEIMNKVELVA